MPYKQTEAAADMFMRHNEVGVYHTYKGDRIENGSRLYWFVTNPYHGTDEAFDVRNLNGGEALDQDARGINLDRIKSVLVAAIETGSLTADGMAVTA